MILKAALTPKPSYSTLQRRFENGGHSSNFYRQRGVRRKSSPILGNICTLSSNDTNSQSHTEESIEKGNPKLELSDQIVSEQLNDNNEGSENEDNNTEVRLSGCRRMIQNRPTRKNSKSKSFSDPRKFRSYSPLPSKTTN